MNPETSTNDFLTEHEQGKRKLPALLNVLTILTFIGCAIGLYLSASNFMNAEKAIAEFDKATQELADAPQWTKNFTGPEAREMVVKGYENRIPILIIGLISIGLCLYGAIEMRKLKKQGYTLWLIGEVLPWIGTVLFIGLGFFKTFYALMMLFPAIFILLYTLQRKHLR